jgi:hypothetical protein
MPSATWLRVIAIESSAAGNLYAGSLNLIHRASIASLTVGALSRLLWTLEPNATIVNLPIRAYAPQPNESFNADANIGHRFAILMANVSTLRPLRASGAG